MMLSAQQSARAFKLRTLCFEAVQGLEVLQVQTSKGLVPVKLLQSRYSDEVEVSLEGNEFRFLKSVPSAGQETEATPIAVAKAVDSSRQLAIFLPGSPGKSPYRVVVIDDSESNWPMGTTLLYNLAPTSVRFDIGENHRVLKAGETHRLPLPKQVSESNQCLVVVSFMNDQGKLVPISSNAWRASESKRSISVSYLDPHTKKPMVRTFPETPPWRLSESSGQ